MHVLFASTCYMYFIFHYSCTGTGISCYNCTDLKAGTSAKLELEGLVITPGCNNIKDEFVEVDFRQCPSEDDVCGYVYAKATEKPGEDDPEVCK